MRIVILSQYFPPEPIARLRDLARHLAEQGHEVTVVTTFPSYPTGRVYPGYRPRLRARATEDGVTVVRVAALPYRGAPHALRLASYASFALAALLIGLPSAPRPDIYYVYHPPLTSGLAALLFGRFVRRPFIYDVQDLWPEAFAAAGLLRERSAAYRGLRLLANLVYRRADHVSVISGEMRDNLIGKGIPPARISVLPNWGDPDVYRPTDERDLRAQLGWEGRFVILLAGNMGLTHGLETVIAAAGLVRDDPRFLFAFVGSGTAKASLMAAAAGLANVQFADQVPATEAARLINAADVLLIHLRPGPVGEFSVPHRIFSYLLCGKPIIAAATGTTAALVRDFACGWACPPADPAALAATIRAAAADPAASARLGRNGLAAATGAHGRASILRRIERMLAATRDRARDPGRAR